MNIYDLAKLVNIHPAEDLFFEVFPITSSIIVFRFSNRERPLMSYLKFEETFMPAGIIVMWHGAIADIPSSWELCDGNNGTPDLRDRFVVGAPDGDDPGDVGGNINHNHTFTGDGHQHSMSNFVRAPNVGTICWNGNYMSNYANATGTTDNEDGRPPFYEIAFIMKV